MRKKNSSGSYAKVWISTSDAGCCCNKLHIISPSVSLGNKILFFAAQMVSPHYFFKDDLIFLLFKAFDSPIALYVLTDRAYSRS